MVNEHLIICGGAAADVLPSSDGEALRLHLYGPDDENRVNLQIEDIRTQMYKEIPDRFRDLLDIAAYVFATDQIIKRGQQDAETFGSSWRRHLRFAVPVRDLDFWRSDEVMMCLRATLGFLSDDHYAFDFEPLTDSTPIQALLNLNDHGEMFSRPEQVIMFSGGLDSLGGAVEEILNQKRRVVLVNHRPTEKTDKRYEAMKDLLDEKAGANRPYHIRVTVNKKKRMNRESTQRTRSFLFMSLGATIANMLELSNVRFYENGVISLNLPVCAQVVGGKATRTTHPRVLHGFEQLLGLVAGSSFIVENPFIWKTKGEVVKLIESSGCADLIGPSISCTHTWERTNKHSHCGTCSQCIDRRFAIVASGLEQHDPPDQYKVDVFTESRSKAKHIQEDKTLVASFLERANQVVRVNGPTQFLARYPEVARALRYVKRDPSAGAQLCYDLYARHANEVNTAVEKMLTEHAPAIRQRTLPVDSMVRIVAESYLPISSPVVPVYQQKLPDNVFRRCGGAWQVRFRGGEPFTVLPWLGASYIHYLLSSPGEPLPAIDIVGSSAIDYCDHAITMNEAISAGLQSVANPLLDGIGNVSDWQTVKECRAEAERVLIELEQAREDGNNVLERQLELDLAIIVGKINESVGIGGRLRQAKDKRKNIRDSFRNNVKRIIDKQIRGTGTDDALADHLYSAIMFGNNPRYIPEDGLIWEVTPVKND